MTPLSPPLTPHASTPPIASPHTTPSPHPPSPMTPSPHSPPIPASSTSPQKRRVRANPAVHRNPNPLASSAPVLHASHFAPPATVNKRSKRKEGTPSNINE